MNNNYKQGYAEALTILYPRMDFVRQAKNPRGKCGANEYLVEPNDGRQPFCRKYEKGSNFGRNLAIAATTGVVLAGGGLALAKGKKTGDKEKKEAPQSTSSKPKEEIKENKSNEIVPTNRAKPKTQVTPQVAPPVQEKTEEKKTTPPKTESPFPETPMTAPSIGRKKGATKKASSTTKKNEQPKPEQEIPKTKISPNKTKTTGSEDQDIPATKINPKTPQGKTATSSEQEIPKTVITPKKAKTNPPENQDIPATKINPKTSTPNVTANPEQEIPKTKINNKKESSPKTKITPDSPNSKTVNKPVIINSHKVAEAIAKNGIDGNMSTYEALTIAPKLRVYNKKGQLDVNATNEMIKSQGKNTKHFEDEIASLQIESMGGKNPKEIGEFAKQIESETGFKMRPSPNYAQFRRDEDIDTLNQASVHYKAHLNLKDLSKLNRDNLIELGQKLKESGYQGDFKINTNPQDAKSRYDLFTFHSAKPEEIEKAEAIARDYFGENIEYIGRGIDKNPYNPKANFKTSQGKAWRSFNQINAAIADKELEPSVFTPDELDFIENKKKKVSSPTPNNPKEESKKPKQMPVIKPEARKQAIKEIESLSADDAFPREWEKNGKRMSPQEVEQHIMDLYNERISQTPSDRDDVNFAPILIPKNGNKRNFLPIMRAYRAVAESLGFSREGYEDNMQQGHLHIKLHPNFKKEK